MDQERFTQRVKQELGGEINPAYVEELLKKDVPGLLAWIHNSLQDTNHTFLETIKHAHRNQYLENESSKSVLLLGTKILEGRLGLALFILNEARSRINAIDISPEK